jgi:uncharacterized protein
VTPAAPDEIATLLRLIDFLSAQRAVTDKLAIEQAYRPAQRVAGNIAIGDDCAAIPDGNDSLLMAAEGMLDSFVADDPWFAGYCSVMVNVSDIAAMGGRPLAVVDVLWTPDLKASGPIWEGITAASRAYQVPIVGGHTTLTKGSSVYLAAAVLGKAGRLITSFEARAGDDLLMVIDLRGSYRRDKPFWNASAAAPEGRLSRDLELLPKLAQTGWCRAGKDISNGGVIGTLAMLSQCSGVGAELWLEQIPRPDCVELDRWLISFPSYGFLLSVQPEKSADVAELFLEHDIACSLVGVIQERDTLVLKYGNARAEFPVRVSQGLGARN